MRLDQTVSEIIQELKETRVKDILPEFKYASKIILMQTISIIGPIVLCSILAPVIDHYQHIIDRPKYEKMYKELDELYKNPIKKEITMEYKGKFYSLKEFNLLEQSK